MPFCPSCPVRNRRAALSFQGLIGRLLVGVLCHQKSQLCRSVAACVAQSPPLSLCRLRSPGRRHQARFASVQVAGLVAVAGCRLGRVCRLICDTSGGARQGNRSARPAIVHSPICSSGECANINRADIQVISYVVKCSSTLSFPNPPRCLPAGSRHLPWASAWSRPCAPMSPLQ